VIEMDEILQKAHHILDTTTKNKEEMAIYEMKLKAEMDYNNNMSSAMKEGIKKGRKKGIKEEKIKIALNLKTKGYSLEEIKEITGLSIKEIESLSENAK
jgi:predicted transposase/invertase (TIGR01784 family)